MKTEEKESREEKEEEGTKVPSHTHLGLFAIRQLKEAVQLELS